MQDNSDLEQKISIRQKAIDLLGMRPGLVVDMFAGEGVITNMLWRHASDKVIAIERDAEKAKKIKVAEVIVGNNMDYIRVTHYADIVDIDAYGMAMPIVERIQSGKVVVFTDGTPEKSRKVWSANKTFFDSTRKLLTNVYVEKSHGGNAYYGFGVRQ